MRHLIRTTKALADQSRIRIIGALLDQELCVCQLIELLGLAPSTVSKHLSILKNARLINSKKIGRWMYYHLADKDTPEQIIGVLEWVFRSLVEISQISQDNKRLKEILKIDPEVLCSRQSRSGSCGTKH